MNDLELCNLAIGMAGGEPIDDFGGDTPLSDFCATAWDAKKAWLLGAYRWVFADKIAQLTQLEEKPAGCPMDFAYARPADLGGAIHAYRNTPDVRSAFNVQVQQMDDYIASESNVLWVEYTSRPEVNDWPPWMVELTKTAFAAEVSRRMLRRAQANEFMVAAFGTPEMMGQGGLMLSAMQQDSRNAPQRSLEYASGGALTDARYGIGVGLGQRGGVAGWPNNGFPFVVEVTGA